MSYFTKILKALVMNRILSPPPTPSVRFQYVPKFPKAPSIQRRSACRLLSPTCRNHAGITLRPSIQRSSTRGFLTSQGSRTPRVDNFILKASIAGPVLYFAWLVVDFALLLWHDSHPPILSGWPGEIREYLIMVRSAIRLGHEDQTLENLEGAWKAVQNAPIESLNPNPSVKMLSVAVWYSDYLEKAGQARKAYKVLCDAVDLYQSRFRELPSSSSSSYAETPGPEKSYLVSVLGRLANLAEMYELTAEGKWMLVHDKFIKGENLSRTDSWYSEFLRRVDSRFRLAPGSAESGEIEDRSTSEIVIPEDGIIPEDEYLFLPFWCTTDPSYACSIAFERFGAFAGNHGIWRTAVYAYLTALASLWSSQRTFPAENRHNAVPELEAASRLMQARNHITDDKKFTRKVRDRLDIFLAESALAKKHSAIIHEKSGNADEALKDNETALLCWKSSTHPAKHREMRDLQERIEALKRNIAEGKTSKEEHMNAMLAKAAQRMAVKESQDKSSGNTSAAAPT